MNWWIIYLRVGLLWMMGVAVARVVDGGWGSSPLIWVPFTALLWPLSVAHAAREIVRGLRGG